MSRHYEYEYFTFEIDKQGDMIDDTYEEHYDSLPKPDKSYFSPTNDDGVRCVVRVRRKEVYDDGYWNDWEEADFVSNPFEPRGDGWLEFSVPKVMIRKLRGFFNNCERR